MGKKVSKLTYFYDTVNKELIYIAESRTHLVKAMGMSRRIDKNKLYLNRYFISDKLLSEKEYSTNLFTNEALAASINEVRTQIMEKTLHNFVPHREAVRDKLSKPRELINTQTSEVKVFPSLSATARYLNWCFVLQGKLDEGGPVGFTINRLFLCNHRGRFNVTMKESKAK